jgi:hypothetical protein
MSQNTQFMTLSDLRSRIATANAMFAAMVAREILDHDLDLTPLLHLVDDNRLPRIGGPHVVIRQSVGVDSCGDVRVGMAQSGRYG